MTQNNSQKRRKVSATVTPELYGFVKNRAKLFGGISSYLKYLILRDMDRKTPAEPIMDPPRSISGTSKNFERFRLHGQLMNELKKAFREKGMIQE